ncbi:MAG: uracil phosphoribosyltransferase [Chthoniobacterales bacterium]
MKKNIYLVDHPLVKLKLSELRDIHTEAPAFRRRLQEISLLLAAKALQDLPIEETEIQTPLTKTKGAKLARPITIVPILRAGLGMAESIASLLPQAAIGHIGMYRDEETLEPKPYYFKMPPNFKESLVVLVDPMLATGNSVIEAVAQMQKHGAKEIRLICIISCPEGIQAITQAYPELPVTVGAIDEKLNEKAYIVPGLGDAGDRYFGT